MARAQAAYSIGSRRTLQQDCGFGVRQIVDIALRALSPASNDTTTAVMCVDYLSAILARLASRHIPDAQRFEHGQLRVIANAPTFASLLALAFDEIRENAGGNARIIWAMLDSLRTIASMTTHPQRHQALRRQAEAISELAARTVTAPIDDARLQTHVSVVLTSLRWPG
jgi:uncharacterized membrane protein